MLILNVILFYILFTYILVEGLPVFCPCFFKIYLKQSKVSDTEYDLSFNSNFSFHVGADTLNLLFLYNLYIFPCIVYVRFDRGIYLSFFYSFFLKY